MDIAKNINLIKRQFNIIGESFVLNRVLEKALLVADTHLSVLITGENGTGKESFAKIIHNNSPRKHKNFITINCGAIPEGTIDSELFGHEKGAFTDAIDKRKGYFEEANEGSIFLDEIAEMPLQTQAKLLRVLENKEIIHIGSSKPQKINIRLIAATNKNLGKMVQEGKFREDLFYRLNTVQLNIPPLRERGEDLLLLFTKFATDFAITYNTQPIYLTDDAQVYIYKYNFPGNIRQLKNIVESMSVFELEKKIDINILKKYLPDNLDGQLPQKNDDILKEQNYDYKVGIELLYKLIIDIKKNNDELKNIISEILKHSQFGKDIITKHTLLQQHFPKIISEQIEGNTTE